MTLKDLLGRLFLATVCLTGAIAAHVYLYGIAVEQAKQSAPSFVPLTEKEALDGAVASCKGDSELPHLLALNGSNCEQLMARDGKSLLAAQYFSHRRAYEQEHVEPRAEELRNRHHVFFGAVYVVIALFVLRAILKWFTAQVLPAIRSRAKRLKEAVPILANLKLHQAENDFATVKNLYENGLITEEMFLKRKAELRAALGENELLRTEDASSAR